jgi:UDP-arabinose 4-epimerase
MHFAAFAYVGESGTDPALYYRNNVGGTLTLLDAMREAGVDAYRLFVDLRDLRNARHVPITETTPQRPVNPYGETKLAIERALYWYGEGLRAALGGAALFQRAGCDRGGEIGEEHDPETHLIPLVLRAALGSAPPVAIFGTDYPPRTAPRSATTSMSRIWRARMSARSIISPKGGASAAVNLATGRGYSVREIIAAVAKAVGRDVPHREAPRRPGDPPALVADPSLPARCSAGAPNAPISTRSSAPRSPGRCGSTTPLTTGGIEPRPPPVMRRLLS